MPIPSPTPVSFAIAVLVGVGCSGPSRGEVASADPTARPYSGVRRDASAATGTGQPPRATPAAARAGADSHSSAPLDELLVRALSHEREGRHDLAHPLVTAVVIGRPDDVVARLCLVRVELGLGTPTAAAASLARAEAVIRSAGEQHPEVALLRGICALLLGDTERGVQLLREELAEGADPATAAMYLADHFGRRERLPDALAVLDAGIERVPGEFSLELAKARLLMDLGRFDEALAYLEGLAGRHSHPRVLYELAVAHRALGHRSTAEGMMNELLERFPDHPWVMRRATDLAQMARTLARDDGATYTARELLAILRSSTDVVLRVRALQTLASVSVNELSDGLRLGMADPEFVVRLAALRLGWEVASDREDWARRGLADAAPAVRAAAAQFAAELPRSQSIPLVLGFLDRERDGYVFEKMHDVLKKLSDSRGAVPSARGLDERGQDEVRAFWRRYWDR